MDTAPWYFSSSIVDSKENITKVDIHSTANEGNSIGDLSKSRYWMEYIEFMNSEGPGAYDVLRCDLIKTFGSRTSFKVWGQEYHLKRLEASYKELDKSVNENMLKVAHEQSDVIINSLLCKMMEHEQGKLENGSAVIEAHDKLCEIVRVTLLWTPTSEEILVRGHASTSGEVMVPYQLPKEIVVTLALPKDDSEILPDRQKPHAKISSWSRKRRPLESKESFMPNGVGEVLLLRKIHSPEAYLQRFEILEGMTSNFFAIYHDGTIRTAQNYVLFGFVRHLVIECAEICGLKFDERAVSLDDGKNGLWAETFITSSSRLIYPIKKILVPDYSSESLETADTSGNHHKFKWKVFWEVERESTKKCIWNELLKEILKRGGYY